MAFRRQDSLRALLLGSSVGLVVLSGGCDGGGPPATGTQVQDPPPIRPGTEAVRQPPPATTAPATKTP